MCWLLLGRCRCLLSYNRDAGLSLLCRKMLFTSTILRYYQNAKSVKHSTFHLSCCLFACVIARETLAWERYFTPKLIAKLIFCFKPTKFFRSFLVFYGISAQFIS